MAMHVPCCLLVVPVQLLVRPVRKQPVALRVQQLPQGLALVWLPAVAQVQ